MVTPTGMVTATGRRKSILITGCSTGIGLATARALKSRGWRVIATARKPADLARLADVEGLETIALEMSDPTSVRACAEDVLTRTDHRLDALYNNAAYGMIGAMEDTSAGDLRSHFEVNVVATHELTRLIVPAMRAAGGGRIVMCSSVLGFVSGPYRGAYAASKYALEAISDALRVELAPAGIHVALIEPGPIETEFLASTLAKFKASIDIENSPHRDFYRRRLAMMEAGGKSRFKLGPQAVADKIVHALESTRPKTRYRVGMATQIAAVLKSVLPDRILDRLVSQV